jgi:hypothetical protein
MTDWKSRLRDADPERRSATPADDLARVREIVIAAASIVPRRARPLWSRPLAVAAVVLLTLGAGAATVRQVVVKRVALPVAGNPQSASDPAVDASADAAAEVERQQLQFSTPGGTRIIWVFDSNFEVKGTLP